MKDKIVIAAALAAAISIISLAVVYSPRCQPGDTATRVGWMKVQGCD